MIWSDLKNNYLLRFEGHRAVRAYLSAHLSSNDKLSLITAESYKIREIGQTSFWQSPANWPVDRHSQIAAICGVTRWSPRPFLRRSLWYPLAFRKQIIRKSSLISFSFMYTWMVIYQAHDLPDSWTTRHTLVVALSAVAYGHDIVPQTQKRNIVYGKQNRQLIDFVPLGSPCGTEWSTRWSARKIIAWRRLKFFNF